MQIMIKNTKEVLTEGGELDGYDCLIKPENIGFWIPFYAKQDDSESHGRGIFAAIQAGESVYVEPVTENIPSE